MVNNMSLPLIKKVMEEYGITKVAPYAVCTPVGIRTVLVPTELEDFWLVRLGSIVRQNLFYMWLSNLHKNDLAIVYVGIGTFKCIAVAPTATYVLVQVTKRLQLDEKGLNTLDNMTIEGDV